MKPKLSENAQAVFDALAGKEVNWASVKEVLQTPDAVIISKAWAELREAGLVRGRISTGELCEVLTEPDP